MQDNPQGLSDVETKEEAWTDTDVLEAIRMQELILQRVFPELLRRAREAIQPLPVKNMQRAVLGGLR